MNTRQKEIIKLLQETNDWISGKLLAEKCHVSSRTIRSDIETINQQFNNPIESNPRYGYKVNFYIDIDEDYQTYLPQTPGERCLYIIKQLLFDNNEMSLYHLQEKLCVSESTIESDIKKIRKMIKIYPELEISRTKSYISIVGIEESKRKLYKDLLTLETKGNFINLDRLNDLFGEFDLLEVKDIFMEICHQYDFEIKETGFPFLMVHIGISIGRMLRRNYIHKYDDSKAVDTKEYNIAMDFYQALKKIIPIEPVEDEITLLSDLLIGRGNAFVILNNQEIDVAKMANRIIDDIYDVYHVDFRNDEELKMAMQSHLSSMICRIDHKNEIENMFLNDIKKNYPMIFDIGIHLANLIQECLGYKISENEIGFLALHIGAAYERANLNKKYRAVLILPHNQSFANLCSSKITLKFEHRLQIVDAFNFYEEKKILSLYPDLILTTIPFEQKSSIPVVQISMFLNANDEGIIYNALNELDRTHLCFAFLAKITKVMSPRFFYKDLDLKTPKEVITYLSDDLYKADIVEENFKERVLQRERLSPASFAYSFATPHAFGVEIKKSMISVAFLKNPIQWGNYQVKLVLLLAVNEKDLEILQLFFEWLSFTINHPEQFIKLLEIKNYDEFVLEIIA